MPTPRRRITLPQNPPHAAARATRKPLAPALVLAALALLIGALAAYYFLSPPPAQAERPPAPDAADGTAPVAPVTPSPTPLPYSPPAPTEDTAAAATHSVDGVVSAGILLREALVALDVPAAAQATLLRDGRLTDLRLEPGRRYRVDYADDAGGARVAETLVIEPDDTLLYRIRLRDTPRLEVVEREVTTRTVARAGVVTTTFFEAVLSDDSLHYALIPQVEEALRWTVDLFHLRPGDRFKLVYRQAERDGRPLGVTRLDAVQVETAGQRYAVFAYARPDTTYYLDYYGRGLRQRFLRAPVKFGIVSSPFSRARRHPVTGELRAHGGTDFAAPHGAPVYALADGTVTRSNQDPRNGRYVELQHDATYGTMYLHLSDFVPGLGVGARVRQGQVIGYVGASGLATGPHVCLRFRENGQERDFLRYRDRVLGGRSVAAGVEADFFAERDRLAGVLEELRFRAVF